MNACLVFDFFGVVCSEIAPFWLLRHFSPIEGDRIKREVVGAADRGLITEAEMFRTLAQASGSTPAHVERDWISYVQLDHDVLKLVGDLRARHKLGLLTNSPSPFVRRILRDNDIEKLFDSVVVSSEHGCAKPDQAIYDIMLKSLSVRPGDALMIDDNRLNIDGAISAGMEGIVYESCSQLRRRLATR